MPIISVLSFIGALFATSYAQATTYYIRTDGGTLAQCDGKTNAAYHPNDGKPHPTPGVTPHCAWNHPFVALPPTRVEHPVAPRIAGGDTVIIARGSYMMGYGAPETSFCSTSAAYDCIMQSVPSGPDALHPTRILGASYNQGCKTPPELWGTQRAYGILQIRGVQHGAQAAYIEVGCLELTDHSGCIENHCSSDNCTGGPQQFDRCKRDAYPFGTWGENGLLASDAHNVYIHDLNIHGFGSEGIRWGRLTNWTTRNVRVVGNGFAGVDGDISNGTADTSMHGTMYFSHIDVEWSGCGERYPSRQIFGCWDQNEGGYGDGFATGHTGGNWVVEDSKFLNNVSDGLDLLYADGTGSITVTRVHSEGNAGNQLKLRGAARVTNSVAIGNCASQWASWPPNNYSGPYNDTQFVGLYNMQLSGGCRASGDAITLSTMPGEAHVLIGNTITGQSSCLVVESETGSDGGDTGSTLLLANNILAVPANQISWQRFATGGGTTAVCGYYDYNAHPLVTYSHNLFYGVKDGQCPAGSACADPLFTNSDPTKFIPKLKAGSPAIGAGDPKYCVSAAGAKSSCNIGAQTTTGVNQ